MLSKIKIPLMIGMSFSGIAFITVKIAGYTPASFTVLSYLYIVLALIISLKYEIKMAGKTDSLLNMLRNIVIVVEGEEMKLRRLLTGEKYKIKGEVEKLQ